MGRWEKTPCYFLSSYLKSQVIVSLVLTPSERCVGCIWKGPHLSLPPNPHTPVVHPQPTLVSSLLPAYPQLPESLGSSHSSYGPVPSELSPGHLSLATLSCCPLLLVICGRYFPRHMQATHPRRDFKLPELKKETLQAKLIAP